jgi:hypothetical protein
MEHQGEFAVQIELDENRNSRIVAVQFSGPEGFTLEETKMAYLQAAVPHVKNDEPAVQLFQDFSGQLVGSGQKDKIKETYVVQVANQLSDPATAQQSTNFVVDPEDLNGIGQVTAFMQAEADDYTQSEECSKHTAGARCSCCNYADWLLPGFEHNVTRES